MRTPAKLCALGICLLTAVIIALALLLADSEPRYGGRSLNYWLELCAQQGAQNIFLSYPNGQAVRVDPEGLRAVRKIGTNAVPLLLKWISYEPSPSRLNADKTLASLRSTHVGSLMPESLFADPDQRKAELAILGFAALGGDAKSAIPRLAQLANGPKRRNAIMAVNALAAIGPDAAPELAGVLTNTMALSRAAAASRLGSLGTNPVILPALLKCVADPDVEVAVEAITALRYADPQDERVFAALSAALPDRRQRVRLHAEQMLWGAGQRAVPLILHATQDPDFAVRRQALVILKQLAHEALTNATPQ